MTRGGHDNGGLGDELLQLVEDYRAASSPNTAVRARLWNRLAAAPAVAATPVLLKTILGSVAIATATAVGLALAGGEPERERSAAKVVELASPERVAPSPPPAEPPVLDAAEPVAVQATVVERRRPSDRGASSPDPTPESDLAAEIALVQRARVAVGRHDPEGALRLTAEHERAFPNGVLVQERRAIRIIALCDVGKAPQGRAEARSFLAVPSNAAFAGLIRGACDLAE